MRLSKSRKWLLVGVVLVSSLACASLLGIRYWFSAHTQLKGHIANSLVPVDLATPDLLIRSQKLSALAADLLKVPLLQKTLTEEFVFYYEEQESRLSLAGSLRRIAYEHQLDMSDQLIRQVLDNPAQLALWRGPNGKLEYWMLTLEQNLVSKAITLLAKVALDDTQLSQLGELSISGASEPVYLLNYGYQHQLVITSHGNRLVLLSDPGMLLGYKHAKTESKKQDSSAETTEEQPELLPEQLAVLSQLLDNNSEKNQLQSRSWQLPPLMKGHSLTVSTNYLSFGYQRFFPAIEALRFDFDGSTWASHALLNNADLKQAWNSEPLWSALPTTAAACASLPVDWQATKTLANKLLPTEPTLSTTMESLSGPMAICWYEKSRLSSPLFVARFQDAEQASRHQQVVGKLFAQLIGAHEFVRGSRFPVEQQDANGAHYWKRVVSARYGSQLANDEPFKDQLSSARYFPVTLANSGPWLFFSPDGSLVEQAIAVQQKKYPALSDGMKVPAQVIATLTPATLSALIEREMYAALPGQDEPLFRDAARTYLAPRLKALSSYPPLTLSLQEVPGSGVLSLPQGRQWQPLDVRFTQ